MLRTLTTKKELILDATLRIVAMKNSFDVTIREIAKEANVNVAAVNYYFKSKDELFKEMKKLFMDNYEDAFKPLYDDSLNYEDKMTEWLKKAISYGRHYPGMLVMLKDKLGPPKDEFDIQMKEEMLRKISDIKKLFINVVKPPKEEESNLFIAFGAALIFPFITDYSIPGLSMSEEEHLQYIETVIKKLKER